MCDFIYPTNYVSDKDIYNLIYRSWFNDLPSVNELRLALQEQQIIERKESYKGGVLYD